MITIYTDGSSRGNPGPGGWGVVLTSEDKIIEIGGRETHTTNNRMELTACIRAIEFVSKLEPSPKSLTTTIYTDSEYVMKGITDWIKKWQAKGWKTTNKKPVLNQDLWQKLLEISKNKNLNWKYVAGHSGDKLNDRCDEIATEFADGLTPRLYNGPKDKYK